MNCQAFSELGRLRPNNLVRLARVCRSAIWTGARPPRADIAEMRHEMQVGFATLETRFERRVGDLITWSFVFWVGAVGAIAMLARGARCARNCVSPTTEGPRALRRPRTGAPLPT